MLQLIQIVCSLLFFVCLTVLRPGFIRLHYYEVHSNTFAAHLPRLQRAVDFSRLIREGKVRLTNQMCQPDVSPGTGWCICGSWLGAIQLMH